jgi:hypothetical protein
MEPREANMRPHGAPNSSGRRSTIDRRATGRRGHALRQRTRKRIDAAFGWITKLAGPRRRRSRGLARSERAFTFAAAACGFAGASP